MRVKTKDLFFKNDGYELRPITEMEASDLEIGRNAYLKQEGIAVPVKITKCFENAEKFEVEKIK
jgi:hypothetical protein